MRLFDAYLFIDWSARNSRSPQTPAADSVWVGQSIPEVQYKKETYHRTRNEAIRSVTSILIDHMKERRRVLVGFDFPYGYPHGFCRALRLPPGPQSWWEVWAELAHRVRDNDDNNNNRFEVASALNLIAGNGKLGPFWGCPRDSVTTTLSRLSPTYPFHTIGGNLQRLRIVETRLRGVLPTWQLYGNGAVGSHALVGIPHVYRLRRHVELVPFSRVWPFETGFTTARAPSRGPFVLHAEIWPGVASSRVQEYVKSEPSLIRDCAQVRAMCDWAAEYDAEGSLAQFFGPPRGLNEQQGKACVEEEGWVLGAP
jgi:hypothetical protein